MNQPVEEQPDVLLALLTLRRAIRENRLSNEHIKSLKALLVDLSGLLSKVSLEGDEERAMVVERLSTFADGQPVQSQVTPSRPSAASYFETRPPLTRFQSHPPPPPPPSTTPTPPAPTQKPGTWQSTFLSAALGDVIPEGAASPRSLEQHYQAKYGRPAPLFSEPLSEEHAPNAPPGTGDSPSSRTQVRVALVEGEDLQAWRAEGASLQLRLNEIKAIKDRYRARMQAEDPSRQHIGSIAISNAMTPSDRNVCAEAGNLRARLVSLLARIEKSQKAATPAPRPAAPPATIVTESSNDSHVNAWEAAAMQQSDDPNSMRL